MAPDPAIRGRYERKFVPDSMSKAEVELLIRLHPAGFSEIYHERTINNLYLDTVDMSYYRLTSAGVSRRRKVRVRWYGDAEAEGGPATLEVKIKSGFVGWKESYPLEDFSLGSGPGRVMHSFERSDLPEALMDDLHCLEPSLLNRYRRRYFRSADGRYRLTVDSDQSFALPYRKADAALSDVVVEVKYDAEADKTAALVAGRFPFRLSRNSKYANGIELLAG